MQISKDQVADKALKSNMTDDYEQADQSETVSFESRLLGPGDRDFLLSPTGTQVKISDLKGKIIGIYFSANWNQPCQHFTTVLTDAYEHLIKSNENPGFEIIFVSSDKDSEAFNSYHTSMPWLAIPFSDLDARRALSQRFNGEGILPRLVILQPNGNKEEPIIEEGVNAIYRYGIQAYPFTSRRLDELVEKDRDTRENQNLRDLLTNDYRDFFLSHSVMGQVPVTSLTGKTVGLYFSAQWCSPGVKFTSKLASIYEKINESNKDDRGFQVVFVSSDQDKESFESHYRTMPWLALPYNDPNIKTLIKYFDVQGIPSLIILGPDGKTLTKHGLNLVNLYEEKAYPFTEDRREFLEKEIDEAAKDLPRFRRHVGHCHELALVSNGDGGGRYVCCDCDEQGSGWAYLCINCGYEVHTKCVRAVDS